MIGCLIMKFTKILSHENLELYGMAKLWADMHDTLREYKIIVKLLLFTDHFHNLSMDMVCRIQHSRYWLPHKHTQTQAGHYYYINSNILFQFHMWGYSHIQMEYQTTHMKQKQAWSIPYFQRRKILCSDPEVNALLVSLVPRHYNLEAHVGARRNAWYTL